VSHMCRNSAIRLAMKQKYCALTRDQMAHQVVVTCFRLVCYVFHRPQTSKGPASSAVARFGDIINLLKTSDYWQHQQVQFS
jgi:hypothetical protein